MAPRSILLTSVAYQAGGGDAASWYLDLRWDVRQDTTPAVPNEHLVAQLLVRDGAGYTKVGKPVDGDGDGAVWSETAAQYDLVPGTSYFIQALVDPGPSWVFSNIVPVLWRAPSITEVACEGGRLLVGWTPAEPGATGAQGVLDAPGGTVWTGSAAPAVPAATGVVSAFDVANVPLGAAAAELTLTLRPVARDANAVSVGPAVTAPALTHPPVVRATRYESRGASGLTFRAEVDPAGYTGTSYLVEVLAGGAPYDAPAGVTATVSGGTATLPVPVHAGAVALGLPLALVVRAAGDVASGPPSAPFPLLAVPPAVTDVDFDGATATVGWTAVPDATGYTITVLAGATSVATADAAATATSATVVVATTAKGGYTVVVQARRGAATGPPSAPAPLVPDSVFLSSDTTKYPYVFPGSGVAAKPAAATVPLPSLGPQFKGPVPGDVFALDAAGTTLTVGTTDFDASPVRTKLQVKYTEFLKAAETAGADPVGVALLQAAIARVMPQTFDETLYYAYGFDAAAGSVDLRPGMVLRVAFADYVNVGIAGPPPYVNGYAAAGTVDYEVTAWEGGVDPPGDHSGDPRVGLDAFLARLVASGALVVSRPAGSGDVVSGAGDAADLFGLLQPARYLRLFVPPQLAAPERVGTSATGSGFAVAAAERWADIEAATRSPQPGRPVVGFRGRAVVRACVHVTVDGADVVVPVGTTVGDLLARRGVRPPRGATAATGVVLDRVAGPPSTPAGTYDVAAARPVRLTAAPLPQYGDGLDVFSLPLLGGDRLTVGR
jgi:hypothetical protein